jgi:hypothetical protein
VAATFDAHLPFDTLPWKSFENFCHDLLSSLFPDAAIHQYGGEGDDQKGIDLEMRWADGNKWTLQAKKNKEFGPAKIRKAIEEHEIDSQKKILLLSRIATAKARDEVNNHPDWDLWDQRDLSQKFRCLDPWDQHHLIDIYFPGQHYELTGKLPSATWLSKDDFYSHFLSDQALFHHCWEVIGRSAERLRLREALTDQSIRIVGLIGGPG